MDATFTQDGPRYRLAFERRLAHSPEIRLALESEAGPALHRERPSVEPVPIGPANRVEPGVEALRRRLGGADHDVVAARPHGGDQCQAPHRGRSGEPVPGRTERQYRAHRRLRPVARPRPQRP